MEGKCRFHNIIHPLYSAVKTKRSDLMRSAGRSTSRDMDPWQHAVREIMLPYFFYDLRQNSLGIPQTYLTDRCPDTGDRSLEQIPRTVSRSL